MAANLKAKNAFNAMKALGVSEDVTKQVLRRLLVLYDNNWELIEEENYRALADAVFEYLEEKEVKDEKKRESKLQDDSEPPSKRLHSVQNDNHASLPSGSNSSTEGRPLRGNLKQVARKSVKEKSDERNPIPVQTNGKGTVSSSSQQDNVGSRGNRAEADFEPAQAMNSKVEGNKPISHPISSRQAEKASSKVKDEKKRESKLQDDSEPPSKRLHSVQNDNHASLPSGSNSSTEGRPLRGNLKQVARKSVKEKSDERNPIPVQTNGKGTVSSSSQQDNVGSRGNRAEADFEPAQAMNSKVEGNKPISHPISSRQAEKASSKVCIKEPKVQQDNGDARGNQASNSASPSKAEGKKPMSHPVVSRETRRVSSVVYFKEPCTDIVRSNNSHQNALIKRKSEPRHNKSPEYVVPITVLPPSGSSRVKTVEGCSTENGFAGSSDHKKSKRSHCVKEHNEDDSATDHKAEMSLVLANSPAESSCSFLIASSPLGEVKISLSCNSMLCPPGFHMPSLDAVLKSMDQKCHSHKIVGQKFSLVKLMEDLCGCFLKLGRSSKGRREKLVHVTPTVDLKKLNVQTVMGVTTVELKKLNVQTVMGAKANHQGKFHSSASSLNGPLNIHPSAEEHRPRSKGSDFLNGSDCHHVLPSNRKVGAKSKRNKMEGSQSSASQSMVPFQHHYYRVDDERPSHDLKDISKGEETLQRYYHIDEERLPHDLNDISKGEERLQISVVNEINCKDVYPPSFHYIPQNTIYQNAHINFSLARIGDEDCCASCYGDCMSSHIPCACARETGGEFAYTREGLLKKEFLDECISMLSDPQTHRLFYCKDCPLERVKSEVAPESCKGHLLQKFIKECWRKCGCNKRCGNRVIQRGITSNLQVFFASKLKGWGLRAVEDIPRGAFICEYVGEILTNTELYERNMQRIGKKHTYPVLLDADWGSEGVLQDDEALCLDATCYGNVARFINHRCGDANLIAIPVEVETPDHHYYHLAFFTTRKVKGFEELTWDYAIDFNDDTHPIEAFRCDCKSRLCRDMKHRKDSTEN